MEEADRALIADTAPAYARVGIHVLGYDLLRNDDASWCISEIDAGNVGGLARLDSFGQGRATEQFVAWLIEHAASTKPQASHENR